MILADTLLLGSVLVAAWLKPRKRGASLADLLKHPTNHGYGAGSEVAIFAPAAQESDLLHSDRWLTRYFGSALLAVGLSSGAHLVYRPLAWLAVPPLLVALVPLVERGWRDVRAGNSAILLTLDAATILGTLALGYVFLCSTSIMLILGSQWLLRLAEEHSRRRLGRLYESLPDIVWIERNSLPLAIPLDEVKAGQDILIAANQIIPVDGRILTGSARIDESVLTGEKRPVARGTGDSVRAATRVVQGCIRVEVHHVGSNCLVAQMAHLQGGISDDRLTGGSRGQRIVEYGALGTLAGSALALYWLGPKPALTALFASFGYTMRYGVPLAVRAFADRALEHSLFIKDGGALERLADIDTVVFDEAGGENSAPSRYETTAEALGKRGCDTILLTGHHADGRGQASLKPWEKAEAIRRLQAEGRKVCFVGDGIRDAVALRRADVSVSVAGVSTLAIDSASIVLLDERVEHLPIAFELARDLKKNLTTGTLLSTVPGLVCIGGVFLGFLGLRGAIVCFNLSVFAAVANAVRPRPDPVPNPFGPETRRELRRLENPVIRPA